MKEATGELNMTVVTLVAVAALGALFYLVLWPVIQTSIATQTCKSTYGSDYKAYKITDEKGQSSEVGTSQAKSTKFQCCQTKDGKKDESTCEDAEMD